MASFEVYPCGWILEDVTIPSLESHFQVSKNEYEPGRPPVPSQDISENVALFVSVGSSCVELVYTFYNGWWIRVMLQKEWIFVEPSILIADFWSLLFLNESC